MQCIRCGGEEFGVYHTARNRTAEGKLNMLTDTRIYQCLGCGKQIKVECRATLVQVYDDETMKQRFVKLEDYTNNWLPLERKSTSNQERMFDE